MPTRGRVAPYQRQDPVAPYLQHLLRSASEEAAHQAELGIRTRARTLMQAYRLAGSRDRGERFLAELRAALDDRLIALTADLLHRAEQADSDEAESQCLYLTTPSPATARRWRIALETELAIHYDLVIALRNLEANQ